MTELIVALDSDSTREASLLCGRLKGVVSYYKIGLAWYLKAGKLSLQCVHRVGAKIFLDLKLFDIPSTVYRTAFEAASLGISMFTVHALGGMEMIKAAVEGAREGSLQSGRERPHVIAVTLLTSWNEENLKEVSISNKLDHEVLELAALAQAGGASGVVTAGENIEKVKKEFGKKFLTVTPGVRLSKAADDQKRITTPQEVARKEGDFAVVGRPILEASEPKKVVEEVLSYFKTH